MKLLLLALVLLAALLAGALALRPALAQNEAASGAGSSRAAVGARGRILAFLGLFLLPLLALGLGADFHLERSKSTEFCLSCHVMEPYGVSLRLAEREYLPAVHFQNALIPRDRACFTCHTQYTMYGDLHAKLTGVKHLWVNYFGTPSEPIALYRPYRNRECLHCHGGARSYLEGEFHEGMEEELASGETSCLECHDLVHAVGELEGLETWSPEGAS